MVIYGDRAEPAASTKEGIKGLCLMPNLWLLLLATRLRDGLTGGALSRLQPRKGGALS